MSAVRRLLPATMLVCSLLWAAPLRAQTSSSWSARLAGPRGRARLSQADATQRIAAARALGSRGEVRASVHALVEALSDEPEAEVVAALLRALAQRGDPAAVEPIAALLPDLGLELRRQAIGALGSIGGDDAARALADWLGAEDVADEVVLALVRIGPSAVPRMARLLSTPSASVSAARVLGQLADTRSVLPLIAVLEAESTPPMVAAAVIDALARIGDARAAPAVAGTLTRDSPQVVEAALRALSAMGAVAEAERVAVLADRGATPTRAEALLALAVLEPSMAAPRLQAALAPDAPPALREASIRALLEHPSAALVPVLQRLAAAEGGARARAAFEAMSRVPDVSALEALLSNRTQPGVNVPLALAVRRGGAASGTGRALARLREDRTPRGRVLSALAGDRAVLPALAEGLRAPEAADRAMAALSVELLGDAADALGPALIDALLQETDRAAFTNLSEAALRLGVVFDPARLDPRWWSPDTAPEALWLCAQNLNEARPRTRQRLVRTMRRSLRSAEPRVRAAAALALAHASETGAWRSLVAALEDEHDEVRLAVAWALASMAVPGSEPAIAARWRIEPDRRVRDALTVALRGGRSVPARRTGAQVLYVRVATAPGMSTPRGVGVELFLPDGRWQRRRALPGGDVLLADLPSGEAEVQVRLEVPMMGAR